MSTVNARSLESKLESLIDLFKNCGLSVCIVTETWIKSNHSRIKEELLFGNNIDIISCNRAGNKRGGGVSLTFDCGLVKLTENKFKKEGHEVISAVGNILGEKRKLVIYGIYLPPNLQRAKVKNLSLIHI